MSTFSKSKPKAAVKSSFKKHNVHEVAGSLAEAKHIAQDLGNAKRYHYRATVTLVGHALVKPYEPIYLDGLSHGMSGYWTVLSVRHILGAAQPSNYVMELEVGTDTLGDTDENAYKNQAFRDVVGELAGQSLRPANTLSSEYSLSPNSSDMPKGLVPTSPYIEESPVGVPSNVTGNPFESIPPDFSQVVRTVQWVADSSSRVVK
jgi:hypothetical protein